MALLLVLPASKGRAQVFEPLGKLFEAFDGVGVLAGPAWPLAGERRAQHEIMSYSVELLTQALVFNDQGTACWGTREAEGRYRRLADSVTVLVRDSAVWARIDPSRVRAAGESLYTILKDSLRVAIQDSVLNVTSNLDLASRVADSLSSRYAVTLSRVRGLQLVQRLAQDHVARKTSDSSEHPISRAVRARVRGLPTEYDLEVLAGIKECWTFQLAFAYDHLAEVRATAPGITVRGAARTLPSFSIYVAPATEVVGGSLYFGPNVGLAQLYDVVADSNGVQFSLSAASLQIGGVIGYFNDATGLRLEAGCYRRRLRSVKWSGPGDVPLPESGPRAFNLSTCGVRLGIELGTLRPRT